MSRDVSIKLLLGFIIIIAFVVIDIFDLFLNANMKENNVDIPRHIFNISRGFIITLDPKTSMDIVQQANLYMHLPNITVFEGINGTHALKTTDFNSMVSLYTRYVMVVGRRDHMQLSNPSMLGCLLSHIHIWKMVNPGEIIAIFEEDAYFDKVSSERIKGLSLDMQDIPWDILMLESGHIIASGAWDYIGDYAATCASNFSRKSNTFILQQQNLCTWFGTRGYLINYEGAQKLLKHAFPVNVQIDAFMGLLAAFNPDFHMYWTRENVVHQRLLYMTQVWDACMICYMPRSTLFYLFALGFVVCASIHCAWSSITGCTGQLTRLKSAE